jgi:hypothetical protein
VFFQKFKRAKVGNLQGSSTVQISVKQWMENFFHVVFFVKRLRNRPLSEEFHTGAVDLLLAFRRKCMCVIL